MNDKEMVVRLPAAARKPLAELRKMVGRQFLVGRVTNGGLIAQLVEDELKRRKGDKADEKA